MEEEKREDALASLFPSVASQMRGMLSTLYLAASSLATAEQRERDPELDKRAALMDQSYYQILRLVGDLSAAARLDNPRPLTMQDCDLVMLVGELIGGVEPLAKMLGLTLRVDCGERHLVCAVHPDSIRQLLYQLLSNAMKFTAGGGTVTVELKRSEDGKQVLLSVADTGCGMDEFRLKTLFSRYRHRELMDPVPHGLGLGLAICRNIAEDHGGALLAESKEGAGSRFTLQFPLRQSDYLELSDVPFDYSGGFNRVLLGLADALPMEAFKIENR